MADVVGIMGTSMSKDVGRPIHFHLESLTEKENEEMVSGMSRIKEVGDLAVQSNKIRLLVDGEYTYMNPGISAVALSMMLAFNKNKAVVCNTYQCYLKVKSIRHICTWLQDYQLYKKNYSCPDSPVSIIYNTIYRTHMIVLEKKKK